MAKSWHEDFLEEENRNLKNSLRACLVLIEDLSNLDKPLFEAPLEREFKIRYARTVGRAKRLLTSRKPK